MKLSHAVWHCQYHIVWTPKYRYRVLKGDVGKQVERCIRTFCEQKSCIIVELNVVEDHVHLLVKIPPKISISSLMGIVKGRTAIRIFQKFPNLKKKPYWGNKFWSPGYCIDTVGIDAEMIRKYVKYQENKDKKYE